MRIDAVALMTTILASLTPSESLAINLPVGVGVLQSPFMVKGLKFGVQLANSGRTEPHGSAFSLSLAWQGCGEEGQF
jgi:hypothetical protein